MVWCSYWARSEVVPATSGPLGERPPALVGHFCNVPTTVSAVLMSLYPAATCHDGPLSLRTMRSPLVAGTTVNGFRSDIVYDTVNRFMFNKIHDTVNRLCLKMFMTQ